MGSEYSRSGESGMVAMSDDGSRLFCVAWKSRQCRPNRSQFVRERG